MYPIWIVHEHKLNYHQDGGPKGILPTFSPSLFCSELCSCKSRRDEAHPEIKPLCFPKRTESVLVVRSKTTLQAGLRLNIAATARLVVGEMWLMPCPRCWMKLIQRTMVSGKMKTQYATGYLVKIRHMHILQNIFLTWASSRIDV